MKDLSGKAALVTGGAQRVGAVIVRELARRGCAVALHYRNSAAAAAKLAAELSGAYGVRVETFHADLAAPAQAEALARAVIRKMKRLDILVNNASIFERTPLGKVTARDFAEHLTVNLTSPYLLAQAAAPTLAKTNGVIVNIADWSGKRPWPEYAPYCASKAGLLSVTEGLAKGLAPKVRVNAVMPGPVLPPKGAGAALKRKLAAQTLLGRLGSPEAVADAVLFCIEADFTTGAAVPVDGGRLIK